MMGNKPHPNFVHPLTALCLCSLLALSGCGIQHANTGRTISKNVKGEGPVTSQNRAVTSFTNIVIEGHGDIEVTNGPSYSFVLEGAENQFPFIISEVRENTLFISPVQSLKFNKPRMKYKISAPEIESISSRGWFTLTNTGGALRGTNIDLKFEGQGSYILTLNAVNVNATANGVLNVELTGLAKNLRAYVDATGSFDSQNLLTDYVDVTLRGTGDVDVYAGERLEAKASGVGAIAYRGSPREVIKDAQGIGRIYPKP